MKLIKKPTATVQSKTPVSAASALKKIKPSHTVNLPIAKGVDLNEAEISIKVNKDKIIVKFLHKGEEVSEQAVTVKKVPTPPWPKDEIITALEQLRLNFNIKK
jgi:hypothetical protein